MDKLNYGVIGNCCTAALISDKGSIDWLYFPNFDSPSIFASLLDREKGGYFGLRGFSGLSNIAIVCSSYKYSFDQLRIRRK